MPTSAQIVKPVIRERSVVTVPANMTFEQAWERTSQVTGWLHEKDARLLWQGATRALPATGGALLEVGAYQGRSTTLLGQIARERNARLIVIDPFWGVGSEPLKGEPLRRVFESSMDGIPHELLEHPMLAVQMEQLPVLDFAFIDGDHSAAGVLIDCWKILPRLRRRGLVAFHDYRSDGESCVKAVVDWACRDWAFVGQASETLLLEKP